MALPFNISIKNFILTLPKSSYLHSNWKFRVFATEAFRSEKSTETSDNSTKVLGKSTEHSSQSKYPRSFVFGKIQKFNTKLREFHRNISDIAQWVTYHLRSTFFRSNQLATWSVGLRGGLWAQKFLGSSPKQARKEEQKIKIIPGDQKSESIFSRIQSGINNRNFGPDFARDFE
jgi:hypothetical protein